MKSGTVAALTLRSTAGCGRRENCKLTTGNSSEMAQRIFSIAAALMYGVAIVLLAQMAISGNFDGSVTWLVIFGLGTLAAVISNFLASLPPGEDQPDSTG